MKAAVIFSIPIAMAKRFGWRWRSADHTEDSTRAFKSYPDCVADAKRNGYEVGLGHMEGHADLASGFGRKRA